LTVQVRFADWIGRRISEYEFEENKDFEVFLKIEKNPAGGRPAKDYHLTLDMAKELSMIERTPKGREARRYFIQCEKELLAMKAGGSPLSPPEAPPFARLDAGLMRELRRINGQLVQAYLVSYGITPAYIGGLLGNPKDVPGVEHDKLDAAPLPFIEGRLAQYATAENENAWYFDRKDWERLCNGYDMLQTAKWLRDLGYLNADNDRLTGKGPRMLFKGHRPNVFVVLKKLVAESREVSHG
jgi:phage anti-repressor protein